jgi:hypothetical protein
VEDDITLERRMTVCRKRIGQNVGEEDGRILYRVG